jgi:hypothetical protein
MKKTLLFLLFLLLLQACDGAPAQTTPAPAQVTDTPPTATAEPIIHKIIPEGGTRSRANAHDHEQTTTFEKKNVIGGDDFRRNQFERPYTAGEMVYLPDLDIVDFGITSDDQFFFIGIELAGLNSETNDVSGYYGVEIDRNRDGRGEILLAVRGPYSTEFTADNVVVMVDQNGDVGGLKPSRPDEGSTGDGYDGVIFDLSQNVHPEDPDLAWVRVIEGERPTVEIAYRKWIFKDGNEVFMWSVWASGQGVEPGKFNWHDNITVAEAGSPNKSDPDYPIKGIAELDNSCRVPLGFDAVGNEPLGCSVQVQQVEVEGDPVEFCDQFASVCARSPVILRPAPIFQRIVPNPQ